MNECSLFVKSRLAKGSRLVSFEQRETSDCRAPLSSTAQPGTERYARHMNDRAVSLPDLIAGLPGPWQPADVVRVNDAAVRVARLDGEFPWHRHEEDELFLCWDGTFRIEMQGTDPVTLRPGDVFVVRSGVEHRPVADAPAHAVLLERPETLQYGN
jgi:mannose-6-phosphate isomerase-like protein (cupin superfamily)